MAYKLISEVSKILGFKLYICLKYFKFKTAEIIDIICTTSSWRLQQVCTQDDRAEFEDYNFLLLIPSVFSELRLYGGQLYDSCIVLHCSELKPIYKKTIKWHGNRSAPDRVGVLVWMQLLQSVADSEGKRWADLPCGGLDWLMLQVAVDRWLPLSPQICLTFHRRWRSFRGL